MLVLSRKKGEEIVIPALDVTMNATDRSLLLGSV